MGTTRHLNRKKNSLMGPVHSGHCSGFNREASLVDIRIGPARLVEMCVRRPGHPSYQKVGIKTVHCALNVPAIFPHLIFFTPSFYVGHSGCALP